LRSESSFATATEDKRETRERRERAREKARLKASERGRFLAFQNDREKDLSPAPARVGAFCERSPLVRPNSVVAPTRAGAAFGGGIRVENASTIPLSPAPRGECERFPKRRLNYALPLGAGALGLALAFLKRAKLGLPTPRPMGLARVVPKETFDWRCPIGRGSPFKVLVKPRFSASPK